MRNISNLTGLSSSSLINIIKINEIKDPLKVSDEQIDELVRKIRLSYDALRTVLRDETMRDASEDGVYYWIPEEYFP